MRNTTIIVDGKKMTVKDVMASDNLSVDSGLYLYNTKISVLPDGLFVRGYIDTKAKALSEGLSVGGDLYL